MATTQTTQNVLTNNNFIDNAQSATQMNVELQTFYERTLLKRLLPNLVFAKFAKKGTVPKHGGNRVNWRKFNSLAPTTTPLTEGVTPNGNTLSMSQVQATMKQYGDFIQFSDLVSTVALDPVLTEAADTLGEQAGLSLDTVMRDSFCLGTNVQYAGGKASTATVAASDKITAAEIRKAVRTLKIANVRRIKGYYIGLIDPSISYDLQSDEDWKAVNQYNKGGEEIYDGEIGKLYGVKFIETTNLKVKAEAGADGIDVHCALIFGEGAFGITDIEGEGATKPKIIVKQTGSAGSDDPLNQRGSAGWKAYFTSTIIDNAAVVRFECAVSD